jgi:hypothetical protein
MFTEDIKFYLVSGWRTGGSDGVGSTWPLFVSLTIEDARSAIKILANQALEWKKLKYDPDLAEIQIYDSQMLEAMEYSFDHEEIGYNISQIGSHLGAEQKFIEQTIVR